MPKVSRPGAKTKQLPYPKAASKSGGKKTTKRR